MIIKRISFLIQTLFLFSSMARAMNTKEVVDMKKTKQTSSQALVITLTESIRNAFCPLIVACLENNTARVGEILSQPLLIEHKKALTSTLVSPFHIAVEYNNEELLKVLLKAKLDKILPARNFWGETVVHKAVKTMRLKLLKILLSKFKALINYADDEQQTPLYCAQQLVRQKSTKESEKIIALLKLHEARTKPDDNQIKWAIRRKSERQFMRRQIIPESLDFLTIMF